MTTTFEEFRSYYAQDLFKIPAPIAIKAIREAIIEFCKKTMILTEDAYNISVMGDTDPEYDVSFLGDYVPLAIDSAYLGEGDSQDTRIHVLTKRDLDTLGGNWHIRTSSQDFTHCMLTQANKIRVYPIPENDVDDELRIKFVVAPTRDATEIEGDMIYDDYVESILPGVLARLRNQRGRSWYDPQEAGYQKTLFDQAIAEGRGNALRGKSNSSMTMSFAGCPAH